MSVPYPSDLTLQENVPPVTTVGADAYTIVGRSQIAGSVNGVSYIAAGALSGADTNTRTVTLYNRTRGVAVASLALVSGVDLADNTAKVITLTATVANRQVSVGDVFEWESLHVLTGIADPGGLVVITLALGS